MNLIRIILPENLFQTWTLQNGSMCMYSTFSRDKIEYKHMAPLRRIHIWNNFSDWNYLFKFQN